MSTNHIPVATYFDNDVTLLYKYVNFYQAPKKFIQITEINPSKEIVYSLENLQYDYFGNIISEFFNTNKTLVGMEKKFLTYDSDDLIMLFYINSIIKNDDDEKNVQTIINQYYEYLKKPIFSTIEQLRETITFRKNQFVQDYDKDIEKYNLIVVLENELNTSQGYPISPVKFEFSIYHGSIDENISPVNGLDIFNNALVSDYVPYIQYNGNLVGTENSYYKILSDTDNEQKILNYLSIIPSGKESHRDFFYLVICPNPKISSDRDTSGYYITSPTQPTRTNTNPDFIGGSKKKIYTTAEISLSNKTITYKAPSLYLGNNEIILNEINKSLGLEIKISSLEEKKTRGEFCLYGISYDDVSLLHFLSNEKISYYFLYINEYENSYPCKKKLTIHYESPLKHFPEIKSSSDISFTLTNELLNNTEIEMIELSEPRIKNISSLTIKKIKINILPCVKISIKKAQSKIMIYNFAIFLSKLFFLYNETKDNINTVYSSFIGGDYELLTEEKKKEKLDITKETNPLHNLQKSAPKIFITNYARKCSHHPILINPDEKIPWQDETFTIGGKFYNRQILDFPPPDNPTFSHEYPTLYLGCPSNEFPFPGVMENNLPNNDKYPAIPCCFKTNQMDPDKNSNYNKYYKNIEKNVKKRMIKINKKTILSSDFFGELDTVIEDLLKNYATLSPISTQPIYPSINSPSPSPSSAVPEKNKFLRYGIPKSKNSFLLAVLEAFSPSDVIPDWKKITNHEKEEIASNYRKHIADNIIPSLLKQELYDWTDEEIMINLRNNEIFFDPYLFYRSVEEIFKVNIYVFLIDPKNKKSVLELPRNKLFHIRIQRYDGSIIIFKHLESEKDGLEYPHCELIVETGNDLSSIQKIFYDNEKGNMSSLLYNTIQNINEIYSWNVNKELIPRKNIYSALNIKKFLNNPIGQYIDKYGKLRAFKFRISQSSIDNRNEIIVVTFPSQPENLPIFVFENNNLPTLQTILSVFQNNIATSISKTNDYVTGIWLKFLDMDNAIYCPISPINNIIEINNYLENLPVGPPNPILTDNERTVDRVKKLKKTINIIFQVILWIYLLSNLKYDLFVRKYFQLIERGKEDSSKIYDLEMIDRILPLYNNVNDAIKYLEKKIPSLVINGKFSIYKIGRAHV